MTAYSRPLALNLYQILAGDQIDMAVDGGRGPFWTTITAVNAVACADDQSEDERDEPCEGTCIGVLSLVVEEDYDLPTWHVQPWQQLRIRVLCAEEGD